jgi:hypothetical protein
VGKFKQSAARIVAMIIGGMATAHAQSLSVEAAAKQIPTASLVNNAAILMLYDLECLTDATRAAGGLKPQINTYAAIGERHVGRDSFRKLFFDELSARRQTLRTVGPIAWCARVTPQLQALGVTVPAP